MFSTTIILSLIIGIDFLSYCLYCSLSPERRYFSFLVNRIEARHFSLSLHLVGPNVSSFRRGNIRTLAYEAALNLKQFRQLTEEQKRLIKKEINLTKKNISSESIETKNIIFISAVFLLHNPRNIRIFAARNCMVRHFNTL